jgi:hypothetical protein
MISSKIQASLTALTGGAGLANIAARLSETAAAAKADTMAPTAAALGGLRAVKREDGFDSVRPKEEKKLEKFTLDADGNLIDSEGRIVQTERNVTSLKINKTLQSTSSATGAAAAVAAAAPTAASSSLAPNPTLTSTVKVERAGSASPTSFASGIATSNSSATTSSSSSASSSASVTASVAPAVEEPVNLYRDPRLPMPRSRRAAPGLQFFAPGTFIQQAEFDRGRAEAKIKHKTTRIVRCFVDTYIFECRFSCHGHSVENLSCLISISFLHYYVWDAARYGIGKSCFCRLAKRCAILSRLHLVILLLVRFGCGGCGSGGSCGATCLDRPVRAR